MKVDVIREHWDEIVRLVASLKAGTVLPSAMLRKLAAYERQNQLDLALCEIGRVERTLFMLDWLESPALRRRCQADLNKSEQRHFLTQAICTFKQGRIADRTHEAQQFRASGLNLIIAAIVYWNSTYIADAVAHLRPISKPAPDELLAHTSPVGWAILPSRATFSGPRGRDADRKTTAQRGAHEHGRVMVGGIRGSFEFSVIERASNAMTSGIAAPMLAKLDVLGRQMRLTARLGVAIGMLAVARPFIVDALG